MPLVTVMVFESADVKEPDAPATLTTTFPFRPSIPPDAVPVATAISVKTSVLESPIVTFLLNV